MLRVSLAASEERPRPADRVEAGRGRHPQQERASRRAEHHAGSGDRRGKLDRRSAHPSDPRRHRPRRPAPVAGHAVLEVEHPDRRRRPIDRGLPALASADPKPPAALDPDEGHRTAAGAAAAPRDERRSRDAAGPRRVPGPSRRLRALPHGAAAGRNAMGAPQGPRVRRRPPVRGETHLRRARDGSGLHLSAGADARTEELRDESQPHDRPVGHPVLRREPLHPDDPDRQGRRRASR